MIKRILLQGLLLVGIAVNVGFLLINLRPDRPHLARKKHVKLLLRASEPRAKWMMQNELSEFADAHDLAVELVLAKDFDEVHDKLVEESKHPSGMLLADVSDEWTDDLREEKAVRPIEEGAEKGEAAAALDEYLPEAAQRSKAEGRIWFLPKRAQVDVVAFLKPAVEDAFLNWEKHRKEIEAALKEANGYGLPKGYELERNPESWDSFDLFVAGWTWAHEPARWAEPVAANVPIGAQMPPPIVRQRLARRTGRGEDAVRDLVGSFYRHGLKPEQLKDPEAPAKLDALQWRALFRKHQLLAPECEAKEGIESFGVNQLLHDRKIAFAPIDQPDAYWVHGGSRRDADPGMRGPSDLAFAPEPTGASVEIDPQTGQPKRKGRTFSFEEVHLWAAPAHTPEVKLSWQLARFVTQRGLQQREAEAQGMLPVRKDLRTSYQVTFRVDWMQQVLHASYVQIARGSGDLPSDLDTLEEGLLAERERALGRGAVTLDAIREAVHGR